MSPQQTCALYRRTVNMTRGQLRRWAQSPCSRTASLSREPITRNLRLLGKPCASWTPADARGARKTVSFIRRHMAQRRAQGPGKQQRGCPTRRDVALMNWAFNPRSSR